MFHKIVKKLFVIEKLFILFLMIFTISCSKNNISPEPEPKLQLVVEGVSCTEAWLILKIENLSLPLDLELMNDSISLKTYYSLNSSDTVLYIDSLLPNKAFNFRVLSLSHGINSNTANAVTQDTTNHNFNWQAWTFGTIGSSSFNDVIVINDNNIWAVGEIDLADTSQNGYTTYNAAHWNGNEWELKRIFFPTVCSSSSLSSYPASSIAVFDENEIWISSGDKISILKDGVQTNHFCLPQTVEMSINKIWGNSSNEVYAVGLLGKIARYYNKQWTKIETGTDLNFYDIYGNVDTKTGELQLFAVGSRNNPLGKCIYQIKGNTAEEISTYPIQGQLSSIWFLPNRHYYVVGDGIYEKTLLSENEWNNKPLTITRYFTRDIRGNGFNDIFVAGAFGECLHFNGISWKSYINETGWFYGVYGSVYCKNNVVVLGGSEGIQAKVLLGKRNN